MSYKLFIPGPIAVSEKTLRAMAQPMIGHRSTDFVALYQALQPDLQALFATKDPVYLSTSSAWGSMEGAVRNVTAKKVLNCMNGAFSDKWNDVAIRCGKPAGALKFEWGQPVDPEAVRCELATGAYDAITLIHNETSCGCMSDIGAIMAVIRQFPGVISIVDTVSSFSALPIPKDELGIDVLITGTQKALALPPGLSLLSVSKRALDRASGIEGRGYYFDFLEFQKNHEAGMTPSTPVIPLIYALRSKLEDIRAEGIDVRHARHARLNQTMRAWGSRHGFGLFPKAGYGSVTLNCFANTPNVDIAAMNKILKSKHKLVIDGGYGKLKGKTFRISNMGDETDATIASLIASLDSALAETPGQPPNLLMKSLIIAEKPSVAADLARALDKVPKKGDHYENDEYVISSAVGHLVELQMPEDIDKKKYGFWRLEVLPIIPEKFQLKPIEDSKERFDHLKKLLARKDIEVVINACDAGREGELIFTYIHQLTKCKLPVKRAWMQTMTQGGIQEAFRNLRDGARMAGLADAARCRSESDWLIGINGTRALTKRMFGSRAGNVASVGRVQTPTLAIVYGRELEIRNFKPRVYWRVTATFEVSKGQYEGVYQRPDFRKSDSDEHDRIDRIWERIKAQGVFEACRDGTAAGATVSDERKAGTQAPPRLYDLTTLQREANNRFGLPARRTLQIAQALYEKHKMITYPRTDSRALPEDYLPTCREALGLLKGDLAPHAARVLDSGWLRANKRIFNNAQISDHFAIIPTTQEPRELEDMEAKIYDMIARRFIAVFHPPAEFDTTTRTTTVAGHAFRTEGKVLTQPGWLAVYGRTVLDEDDANSKALPALSAADGTPPRAKPVETLLHEESTRPPPRYTEATLLSAMEGAGKLIEDDEFAEAMKERGLGTPATRADTIDGLINQRYMERAQRELIPTPKAEQLIQFLAAVKAEQLTSPAMTGEWEFKLRQMEHGKFTREKFMAEVVERTRAIVEGVKTFEEDDSKARTTDILSPTDGKPLVETLRGYKSQDGELMVYKVIGNRKMEESEIKDILALGQLGPLDGFRSRAGKPFSAVLRYNKEEKKLEFVFDGQRDGTGAIKIDFTGLQPVAPAPEGRFGAGASVYETPQSYVVRKVENGEDKILARCSKRILARDIPREQFLKLIETGKTDLLDKFWSQRTRRPFSAFLALKEDGSTGFEFAPRAPKDPNAPAKKRGGVRRAGAKTVAASGTVEQASAPGPADGA